MSRQKNEDPEIEEFQLQSNTGDAGVLPACRMKELLDTMKPELLACVTAMLATHARLVARELSNETLVWIPRSIHRPFYDQVVNYLRTLKFDPRRFQEAHTITQALDFAAHGVGIALVPQSASRFQRPGVLFRPLTDGLIRIETALFVRKDQMRAAVKDFISLALSGKAKLKLNPLEKS
ncbi:MAG TPA: LysR family substrate-binding domain-containing protein [Edaphobacter sp.]|nr:LysR family substrate-binding domain-containing protein [Edaphobacter sp.]